MQNVFRAKRAKGVVVMIVTYLLADWSNRVFHIHDEYRRRGGLVCHFEMFAVGVRCTRFPSTREANAYFEREMATTFGEGQSMDTHFCHWLVFNFFAL